MVTLPKFSVCHPRVDDIFLLMWSTLSGGKKPFRAIDDAPFIIYLITLLLMALACAVLSCYIIFFPIPNPKIKDWRSFLHHFRELDICLGNNDNGYQQSAFDSKFKDLSILNVPLKKADNNVTKSLFLRFSVKNLQWFCSQNTSIFSVIFELPPKAIDLDGDDTVDLHIGFILTAYQFDRVCHENEKAGTVEDFKVSTCVHFSGSSSYLPNEGDEEQCINDIDPDKISSLSNYSDPLPVFRPIVATQKKGVLAGISAGSGHRICNHGGALTSPKFTSKDFRNSLLLPQDICRNIAFRLLMASVVLLSVVPISCVISFFCRKIDNSHVVHGQHSSVKPQ